MATIKDLHVSITQMSPEDRTQLLLTIRENRRRRPTKKVKAKKSTARTKRRAATKKNPSQQDAFAMLNGMSEAEKIKLAQQLIGGKKLS